jgi:hypothetical protein
MVPSVSLSSRLSEAVAFYDPVVSGDVEADNTVAVDNQRKVHTAEYKRNGRLTHQVDELAAPLVEEILRVAAFGSERAAQLCYKYLGTFSYVR